MDKRIYRINKLLTDYSMGKFDRRLELSTNLDVIDAFINGVNMLGEELNDTTIRKNYFMNIMDSVSDMVFVLNRSGRIEEVNKSGCMQLEHPKEELIGAPLDLWQESGRPSLFAGILQQLKAGKNPVIRDSVFVTSTHKRIPVHVFSAYLMNDVKKKSSILLTAKDMTLQIQSENLLLRAIIDTQENERQRLAKDLHDSLGQQIAAIKFYISATVHTIDDKANKEILLKSNDALMNVLADMRNICFNLMPKTLEEFGLIKAVEELCNQSSYATKIRFTIYCSPSFPSLQQHIEIDIFRVVQEFINNALQHGHANKIWMRFQNFRNNIRILLRENGSGFDLKTGQATTGRGLQNVQSRIKSHNGEVKIKSIPGSGTQYQLTIPIYH